MSDVQRAADAIVDICCEASEWGEKIVFDEIFDIIRNDFPDMQTALIKQAFSIAGERLQKEGVFTDAESTALEAWLQQQP